MQNVLIVRTGALGDIIHSIPLAGALKDAYPQCRVSWVVEQRYVEILAGNPWIDETIPVRFKEWKTSLRTAEGRRSSLGVYRNLKRQAFDVAVDPQGLIRSGLICYLSGAPVRIGFPRGFVRESLNRIFTNVQPDSLPARSHVIDRNLALLHPLGIQTRKRSYFYHVPFRVEEAIGRFITSEAGEPATLRVVIHPCAGWPTKQWNPENYAEIAGRLIKEWGARVFLLWGPGEKQIADRIQGLLAEPVCVVPEWGLKEMAAFLRVCDLFLGGDSGPMHLASSMGKAVVGLFGPSDPVRNGPFLGRHRVVKAPSPCSPCYRRTCARADCMDTIQVDQVWDTLTDFIAEIQSEGGG